MIVLDRRSCRPRRVAHGARALVGCLAMMIASGCGGDTKTKSDSANQPKKEDKVKSTPPPVESDDQLIRTCIEGWMKEQKAGKKGGTFWQDADNLKMMLAVRSWSIQNPKISGKPDPEGEYENSANVKVKIESGEAGAEPTSKDWNFALVKIKKEWKLSRAFE